MAASTNRPQSGEFKLRKVGSLLRQTSVWGPTCTFLVGQVPANRKPWFWELATTDLNRGGGELHLVAGLVLRGTPAKVMSEKNQLRDRS